MPAGMVTGCHRGEKNATMARLCHVGEATATSAGKLPRWRALPRWSSTLATRLFGREAVAPLALLALAIARATHTRRLQRTYHHRGDISCVTR